LSDQNDITDGEILNLFEISENVFVLSRQHFQIDDIADKLAKEWRDSGESLETMLSTLRDIRSDYLDKKS